MHTPGKYVLRLAARALLSHIFRSYGCLLRVIHLYTASSGEFVAIMVGITAACYPHGSRHVNHSSGRYI
jgi:hypothetical protein